MARITVEQAKAWLEPTKLQHPDNLDEELLGHVETEVLARITSAYSTTTWVDSSTTPLIVQTIISKMYASFYYSRAYSEDNGTNDNTWATKLQANAEMLITGIVAGTIEIPEVGTSTIQQPAFYPTDASSAMDPRDNNGDDTSVGPSYFSMGTVF